MRFYSIKFKKFCQIITVYLVFTIYFSLFTFYTRALDDTSQKILDLRKQIEELTRQADQYKGTIAQKQKQANTLKQQIDLLNNQINKLQIKIVITTKEVSSTKLEIADIEGKIFDAVQKINKEKQEIGDLVSIIYEKDKVSLPAMLIKSSSLSDFTGQAYQIQNLNSKLIILITDLKAQKEIMDQDKQRLDLKRTELEALNNKQVNQKVALSGTRSNKDTLLAQTRGQEAKYQQLLSDVEKKKEQFFQDLKGLEDQALKSGAFIVHVFADSVARPGSKIFRWPYDDYYVTQSYGYTAYARRGAYGGAPHNGIDMSAGYGSGIRPVAAGKVLASGFNNGWGNWIAIVHPDLGNLVSLYGHMRAPAGLANGTPVAADSIIGYEGSTGNATGSHLHLSIYRDFFTYINPKNGQLYFNYFEGTLNPLDYL